jgi:hypothetical protein
MQTLIQDLRYSWRQLIKSPGFTLTAVIIIAEFPRSSRSSDQLFKLSGAAARLKSLAQECPWEKRGADFPPILRTLLIYSVNVEVHVSA